MLRSNCIWSIRDDHRINIWNDLWLPIARCLSDYKAAGFDYDWELINQQEWCWRNEIVEGLFPPWIAEEILSIPFSKFPAKERLMWRNHKSGKFSVRTCYHMLHEQSVGCVSMYAATSNHVQPWFWKNYGI